MEIAVRDVAVAARVFLQIFLVVFFRGVKILQRFNDDGKLTWIDFKVYPDNDNNLQFVRVVGDSLANP